MHIKKWQLLEEQPRKFFLLFFPCCLFYFCLTFVCPFCVFYHAHLVFLYIFLDLLPLGKNAPMQREENIFLFFFPTPRQGSHMHWLRAIFGTSFELNLPSSLRFWQILVHFLFLKHRNISRHGQKMSNSGTDSVMISWSPSRHGGERESNRFRK